MRMSQPVATLLLVQPLLLVFAFFLNSTALTQLDENSAPVAGMLLHHVPRLPSSQNETF